MEAVGFSEEKLVPVKTVGANQKIAKEKVKLI